MSFYRQLCQDVTNDVTQVADQASDGSIFTTDCFSMPWSSKIKFASDTAFGTGPKAAEEALAAEAWPKQLFLNRKLASAT